MTEGKTYDLVVIGTGTAAQVTSFRVRAAGWSVAVIDHLPFGGTCALRGCDPKKILISGAEVIDMTRRMHGRGVTGELAINWPDLMAFKRTLPSPIRSRKSRNTATRRRALIPFMAKPVLPDPTPSRLPDKLFRPGMC